VCRDQRTEPKRPPGCPVEQEWISWQKRQAARRRKAAAACSQAKREAQKREAAARQLAERAAKKRADKQLAKLRAKAFKEQQARKKADKLLQKRCKVQAGRSSAPSRPLLGGCSVDDQADPAPSQFYVCLRNPKLDDMARAIAQPHQRQFMEAIEFLQCPGAVSSHLPLGNIAHSMWSQAGCNVKLPPKNGHTGFVPFIAPTCKKHGATTQVRQLTLRVSGPGKAGRLHIMFRHDYRIFIITRVWVSSHKKSSDKHGNENYHAGSKDLHLWQSAGGTLW